MLRSSSITFVLALLATLQLIHAANANQWKGKSIYQLITDRFAPPSATAPARTSPLPSTCDPALQSCCCGTWLSIIDKLDYIQGMGFDAIWISPVSQNVDVYTPYNYAYHGYWVHDPLTLNPRFGSSDDLKALSNALHQRGMYLMVDVVINNVPSLSVNTSLSTTALQADGSRWTDPAEFHPQCWIDFSNTTSVEYCWLGDDKLPLMDVNTENPTVVSTLQSWIANLTQTYSIAGLRIDAAKQIPGAFWPGFCGARRVFCIGEVYGSDIGFAPSYQTQKWMDAVLGYPLYYGIVNAFGAPSVLRAETCHRLSTSRDRFSKLSRVLGDFIENHDLPLANATVDPQLAYNAVIAQFNFDGIPIVYYGQEQEFSEGSGHPYNRQALWPSNYANTSTYNRISKLNGIRHAVISNNILFEGKSFLNSTSKILASSPTDVVIRKGPLLAVLTNRGSPSQNESFGVPNSGWPSQSNVIDILSCQPFSVGTDGTISVSYSASGYGGMPYLFVSQADAAALKICGSVGVAVYTAPNTMTSGSGPSFAPASPSVTSILFLLGLVAAAALSALVLA